MIEPTILNKERFDQEKANYDEAVSRIERKGTLSKTVLVQGLLASFSFTCALFVGFLACWSLVYQHYFLGVTGFLIAWYELWWGLRKTLGCITLIVGGTK